MGQLLRSLPKRKSTDILSRTVSEDLPHFTCTKQNVNKRGPTKNVYSNTELSVPVHFGPSYWALAITPFKVIQGHRFWYQSKAHMRLPISD